MTNGFSGLNFCDNYYYALYNITNTMFGIAYYFFGDQDVSFNPEKFEREEMRSDQFP